MKEPKKVHLAGLFDAEGHLSICRHFSRKTGHTSYGVSMAVDNTYFPLMKYLVTHFGGDYRFLRRYDENYPNRLPLYSWRPSSVEHAEDVLSLVLPYLLIKKERGLLCKEFLGQKGQAPEFKRQMHARYLELIGSVTTNTSHVLEWNSNLINPYFAGFTDGEGSIGVYKHKQSGYSRCSGYFYKPRVTVSNTDLPILKTMQQVYEGGVFSYKRKDDPTRMTAHLWSLNTNRQIEAFLLKTLPYMVVKREQAQLMLDFVRMGKEPNPVKRKEIADKMRALKRLKIESDLPSDVQSAPAVTQVA